MSQPCPYCGNRDFEEEDGLLVCTSCGRQQEGGLQVADDDADFGTQGKLVRRKIERQKVKVTKIYRGARAYKLYLQAWQHIMWRQSYALINGSTKAPSHLWTVVRDLWTLKLSTLLHRLDEQAKATSDEGSPSESDHDVSSATESGLPQERSERHLRLSLKLWDTISLIYLSALLIRYPISLSNIYALIRSEDVPFIRASRFIPYEITSHLPSEYQLALDTITIPQRHELSKAAFQFIRSFSSDFGMDIPALNWKILLYKWIVELSLPLDIYSTVKLLANLLDYNFTYQLPIKDVGSTTEKTTFRRTPVAMPELQLISLIMVATKLLFPFPISDPNTTNQPAQPSVFRGSPPEPSRPPSPLTDLTLNWSTWLNLRKSSPIIQSNGPQKHIETSDRDVANMTPEELDEYISWYQHMFTTSDHILRQKKTDLEMSILDLFPVPEMSPRQKNSGPQGAAQSDTTKTSLAARIQSLALDSNHQNSDQQFKQAVYPIFPSIDALVSTNEFFDRTGESTTGTDDPSTNTNTNNPILFFHELAAEIACTDLRTLVRAVRYTEGKLEAWIDKRRREREWAGVSGGESGDKD